MLRSLLQPGVQARLWSVQGTIWLGQNATLFAHVQDAAGRPLVDQPVTFTTTWGELSALSGVQTITGNAVTARTNDVGLVELRLRHAFPGAAQRRPAYRARTGGGTVADGRGMADCSQR